MMNCKPGDIAVIVGGGSPQNHGKFVTVLRPEPHPLADVPCWMVELSSPCVNCLGRTICDWALIRDEYLRPIRDNDGQDESLTWAGKPQKETVKFTSPIDAENYVLRHPTEMACVVDGNDVLTVFFGDECRE